MKNMDFDKRIKPTNVKEERDDEINVREIFEKYLNHWKWFVFSLIISLLVAFIYLRYVEYKYEVNTIIYINDKESGGISSELSAFDDLGVLSTEKPSIINEKSIIKSRTLMQNVVKDIGVNVTYYIKGQVVNHEIYGDRVPFKINFFEKNYNFFNLDTSFMITIKPESKFILEDIEGEIISEVSFGENLKTDFGLISITQSDSNLDKINEAIIVKISPVKSVAFSLSARIKVEPLEFQSSLLVLSLEDKLKQKAINILDCVVRLYNEEAVAYKLLIASNTDNFIDERISEISNSLSNVDKGVEEFKKKYKLTNLQYESGLDLESNSELQKTIVGLNAQIQLVKYIRDFLENNQEELIPENLGLDDRSTSDNTVVYNRLLLERNRIIKSSSKLNPAVINLEYRITTIRKSIMQGLENFNSSLRFELQEAKNQEYRLNAKRGLVPQQEREFQDIKRKQLIIETLYLYLLKKREENAISLGIPVPNAKVIDFADGSNSSVSPNPKIVYILASFIGLLIPFIFFSLLLFLDNKIHKLEDIEMLNIPILGEIPKVKSKTDIVVLEEKNSIVSESFRLLRTNLNFMLANSNEGAKKIFISSTIGGEGKTFTAVNLAAIISSSNKKVLLVGADLRKPKLGNYLKIKSKKGLSHYLSVINSNISDLLITNDEIKADVLLAGEIPPNPAELFMNGRFEKIMEFGNKHYDYVIVDTSPVGVVTDALLISTNADMFIYVIRANYLDRKFLNSPKIMYEKDRLPNMALLLNDSEVKNNRYGYKY